jgi:hypothetical protein
LCPSGNRTQEKQLFEREFALEDVAFGQSPFALQVERRDDLPMQDDVLMFGAYSAMVLTTLSPNFSFSVSQSRPGASL